MRPAGRRRPKESFAPDHRKPPPPTAPDSWQYTAAGRDSDASLCSSRPSSASNNRVAAVPVSDRPYQQSAMRIINSFLASHSVPVTLKPPYPSAKDIIETLKFVLSAIEFPVSNKLEEDLFTVLKLLNCPIKSALKAPGTPHSWPSLLGVIHWLVQVAIYNEHLSNSSRNGLILEDDSMFAYNMRSYLSYIRGDDDAVENEDRVFLEKLQKERDSMEENMNGLGQNVQELERKLEGLKNGPSPKEVLETEKNVLEEDVKKFYTMIEQLDGHIANVEKTLEEKEKELETKIVERKKISEENVELKKKVEEQAFNARDAERMKRDLQAVERDIAESEAARNTWEEKSWDLDGEIGRKFQELQSLMIECNQAIRKLKLGSGFQYELNAKGSTPAEVLGVDYKSKLMPALDTLADETKKTAMLKAEEQISLQKISVETANKIEAKRNYIASLQSLIDEVMDDGHSSSDSNRSIDSLYRPPSEVDILKAAKKWYHKESKYYRMLARKNAQRVAKLKGDRDELREENARLRNEFVEFQEYVNNDRRRELLMLQWRLHGSEADRDEAKSLINTMLGIKEPAPPRKLRIRLGLAPGPVPGPTPDLTPGPAQD